MQKREYSDKEIIYDEFYKLKLKIVYFIFTQLGIGILFGAWLISDLWYKGSFQSFFTLYIVGIMFFYKTKFNMYTGEEYNVFVIAWLAKGLKLIRSRQR